MAEPSTPTTPTTTPPSTDTTDTTAPPSTVAPGKTVPSTTPPKPRVPSEPPAFPPEASKVVHGGTIWGVYLAAVAPDDPAGDAVLAAAGQAARDAGYGNHGVGRHHV